MKGAISLFCMLVVFAGTVHGHSAARHSVRLVEFNPPASAPDFRLPVLNGGSVSLAHYRGRFLLLNFWATWCPPCLKEMPSMERLSRRLSDYPFAVLAVSLDEEGSAEVATFIEKLAVTFTIALDPDSKVAAVYGGTQLPTTFLIDPGGRVVAAAKGERDWGSENVFEFLVERINGGKKK